MVQEALLRSEDWFWRSASYLAILLIIVMGVRAMEKACTHVNLDFMYTSTVKPTKFEWKVISGTGKTPEWTNALRSPWRILKFLFIFY